MLRKRTNVESVAPELLVKAVAVPVMVGETLYDMPPMTFADLAAVKEIVSIILPTIERLSKEGDVSTLPAIVDALTSDDGVVRRVAAVMIRGAAEADCDAMTVPQGIRIMREWWKLNFSELPLDQLLSMRPSKQPDGSTKRS